MAGYTSAYYNHKVIAAARRGGAIKYPHAIWEETEERWISDAEVAEIKFTAFTSRRKAEHVPARLIVRRVKRFNPESISQGQATLFGEYRHHAVFTDSPLPMLSAEAAHRDHAIVEQVIASSRQGSWHTCRAGDSRCVPTGRR